jgi:hypothetical protein
VVALDFLPDGTISVKNFLSYWMSGDKMRNLKNINSEVKFSNGQFEFSVGNNLNAGIY